VAAEVVAAGGWGEAELAGGLGADEGGQELVVGDVLEEGGEQAARLLVEALVAPRRVQPRQLARHPVVLAHKHCVDAG